MEPAVSGSKGTQKSVTPPETLESDTPAGPTAPPGAAEVPKSRKDEGFPTWGFDLMKFWLHQV